MKFSDRDIARFMAKVSKPESSDGCWLWIGGKTKGGYGNFWLNGRLVMAHRFARLAFVGSFDSGLDIDHLCRCRQCVNPSHLEPVTRKENLHRSPIGNSVKTSCPRGHAYTETNTRIQVDSRGHRHRACKECERQRIARRAAQ